MVSWGLGGFKFQAAKMGKGNGMGERNGRAAIWTMARLKSHGSMPLENEWVFIIIYSDER